MSAVIKANNPDNFANEVIADSAFREMDRNKDGWVTCEEFCTAVLAQEKFSKFLAVHVIDMFT